jgi:hypothetical protein
MEKFLVKRFESQVSRLEGVTSAYMAVFKGLLEKAERKVVIMEGMSDGVHGERGKDSSEVLEEWGVVEPILKYVSLLVR